MSAPSSEQKSYYQITFKDMIVHYLHSRYIFNSSSQRMLRLRNNIFTNCLYLSYAVNEIPMNIFPSLIRKEQAHFDFCQKAEKGCVNQARQALHATGCDWLREDGASPLLAENAPTHAAATGEAAWSSLGAPQGKKGLGHFLSNRTLRSLCPRGNTLL